jgi:hypothetical protein
VNSSRKPRFTRRHIGQTIISSVALAAIPGILSLVSLGLPDSASAQPAPAQPPPAQPAPPGPPAAPPTPPTPTITFGQTITGSLASTDNVTRQGVPRDHYRLISDTVNSRFTITLVSPSVPLESEIAYRNVALRGDPLEPLLRAGAFEPGQQVQYSGTLENRGEYQIEVTSADIQRPTGSYTINLTGGAGGAAGAAAGQ